ncbi:hypothetical protein H5410_005721 [Solanum commersonii]|uniref:Uncharacterized protein n=1 Tax=Solanum commersonii TaxID=4109 RepID=A0A9J6A941_SOLCO|nr:hypothetical protein H5410_005721 [Solanum commersonii]
MVVFGPVYTHFNYSPNYYNVPTTLFVMAPVSFPPKLLAMPKSDIFGFISVSSKTLLGLRSLWIIRNLES